MAKDDHWFKFFYKLFIISTQGWKDDEVGAYIRLLIKQFDSHGIPDDPIELGKIFTSYKKNWTFLSKKFKKCEDGLLRNDFMKDIREERDEKSLENKKNGSKGGKANKKRIISEPEANALKNESHIYSPFSSSSDSPEDERGPGKEETVEVSPEGFFSDTLDKTVLLTEIQIGNTIEYIRIKSKKIITISEVKDQWEAFKIQFFAQHLWYDNIEKLLGHFRDSLKLETKNGTHQQSPKSSNRKSAGAEQLLDSLKNDIAGLRPGS